MKWVRHIAVGTFVVVSCAAVAPVWAQSSDTYSDDERSHWSLLPRAQPAVPPLESSADAAWAASPLDAFVLERLRRAKLNPAPEADRRTLVRRLSFHLVGLPPSLESTEAFLNDPRPDAYDRLVDRLLASPHYGEAWAQHWLDVVRYAESEGFEYDRHRPGAWRYRDYVIESFNRDQPYDQFVLEQVAGDELPEAESEQKWARVAAGFHRLGPVRRNAGNSDVAFSRNEVLTEVTDAVGTAFMGLTVGCARCHDHMFDAIRQRDYYRLQAFFAATHEHNLQIGEAEEVRRWNEENDQIQAEITRLRELIDDAKSEEREELVKQLRSAQKKQPAPLPTISSVINDAAKRSEIRVLERGQTDKPKEIVGPRIPGVFLTSSAAELPVDVESPKSYLAKWLIEPENPLTARVFVNRLWQFQFGAGLVATPNDFGVNGAAPSHPQLLDYLANELVRGGWEVKRLQRMLVTSSTWKQASAISSASNPQSAIRNPQSIDPDNRLLWHFPRRRLEAEQLRDAMLAVSGRLQPKFGGESVMPPVKQELVDLLYDPAQWKVTPDLREHDRRSLYLVAKRNLRLPFMEVFDQPDLLISCARRQSSTHAPQALEMLNGETAMDLAKAFAERLRMLAGDDRRRQVQQAFLLAAGREPTADERRLAAAFLRHQPLEEFALAVFNLNAFLYVE